MKRGQSEMATYPDSADTELLKNEESKCKKKNKILTLLSNYTAGGNSLVNLILPGVSGKAKG